MAKHDLHTPGLKVVISAPSGGGKSTICREVVRRMDEVHLSVSATTRPPGPGEQVPLRGGAIAAQHLEAPVAVARWTLGAAFEGDQGAADHRPLALPLRQVVDAIAEAILQPHRPRQLPGPLLEALLRLAHVLEGGFELVELLGSEKGATWLPSVMRCRRRPRYCR
mgnify:CR=1 FL=1